MRSVLAKRGRDKRPSWRSDPGWTIYSHPFLLETALRLKYRSFYHLRLEKVAAEIHAGARVVDLCCGACVVYRQYLSKKNVDYLGVDINPRMVCKMQRKHLNVRVADVRAFEIPRCDVLLCLASLYQFFGDSFRILKAAQRVTDKIVILEPTRNLASSRRAFMARIGARMSDFGEGPVRFRFDEPKLVRMWKALGFQRIERVGIELMAVWTRNQANGSE